jgi:hypothetical protein
MWTHDDYVILGRDGSGRGASIGIRICLKMMKGELRGTVRGSSMGIK